MEKRKISLLCLPIIGCALIIITNFIRVETPLLKVLNADERNNGIKAISYYDNLISPNTINFDLWNISASNAQADVMRVFLQFASSLKERDFSKVYLSFRGSAKFYIDGDYFKILGNEYNFQNPVFTLRTFPQHVHQLDGSDAYPTWAGGSLGVFAAEMEDLKDFQSSWYLNEIFQK